MLKDIKISITKLQNKSGSSSLRANITAELSLLFNPKRYHTVTFKVKNNVVEIIPTAKVSSNTLTRAYCYSKFSYSAQFTIPKEIIKLINPIDELNQINMLFDLDNNKLIIKKHDQVCALCYNKCEEDAIEVNGNLICSKCVCEIRKGA